MNQFLICMMLMTSTISSAHNLIKVSPEKPNHRELFDLSDVRLGNSQFKDIQELDHQYLLTLQPDRLLSWFRREAGLTPKASPYPFWESEDVWGGGPLPGHVLGFYLSSMAMMYSATGDEQIRDSLDHTLREMDACQQAGADGYLLATINGRHLFEEVVDGKIETYNATINGVWEPVYVMNKIMLGLYQTYLRLNIPLAKDILVRMADWFGHNVLDRLTYYQIQQLLVCEHGSINESFADVYSITGEKRFLEWAKLLNDEDMLLPAAEGRDILNGWHANTQIPKFTGFQRLYTYTGERQLSRAAMFFWNTVTRKHTWVNGGNSTGEHFFPTEEFEQRIANNGGPESCNSVNMMRLTEALYRDAPSSAMIDYYENVLFNHILANYEPRQGMCAYFTSMRPGHYKMYGTKYDSFWCCTGTGMEAPAKFGQMIYAHRRDSLFVNLFIPSEVCWREKGVKWEMQTSFPDDNKVTLTMTDGHPANFVLHLRSPKWNQGKLSILLNGKPVKVEASSQDYIAISRIWQPGDKLTFTLNPGVSVEYLQSSTRYAAVKYGPIVMAAKVDNCGLKDESDFRVARKTVACEAIPLLKSPALIGSPSSIRKHIKRMAGTSLSLLCEVPVASTPIQLVPFNRIHFHRYSLYFPIYPDKTLYLSELNKEQTEINELDMLLSHTVDRVNINSPASEQAHCMEGVNMAKGEWNGSSWRHASQGGYIMYRLHIDADKPQAVYLRYCSTDEGQRAFDIMVDGHVIASVDHSRALDGSPWLYGESYPIPATLLTGKQYVTVKIQARRDQTAGGIFDIRIIALSDADNSL